MMTVMSSMVAPGASIDHNFNSNQMLFSAHSASLVSVGWQLRINVNEFDVIERSLRVTGETHIGGVIFQLVEQLSNIKNDWSDFSLWWPEKNQWLNKTKMTLDQYGVQADALLHFTRIHKCLRVQLPDLQILDLNVDYSISLFYSIKQICKEIGIRHSEEVSILKTLANNPLNQTKQTTINKKKKDKNLNKIEHQLLNIQSYSTSNNSKDCSSSVSSSTTSTLNNSSSNSNTNSSSNKLKREHSTSFSIENLNSFSFNNDAQSLTLSPIISINNYLNKNSIKFKSVFDKTRINSRWLDSSKSLMEQNVNENDLVQLKFKYFAFYELNGKYDSIRINQIYEQAKWSILTEEIDCTEQELINFAALQLQIQLQTKTLTLNNCIKSIDLNSPNSFLNKVNLVNRLNSINMEEPNHNNNDNNNNNNNKSKFNHSSSLISSMSHNSTTTNNNSKCIIISDSYNSTCINDEDDVDTALSKLEKSLDVVQLSNTNNESNMLASNTLNKNLNDINRQNSHNNANISTNSMKYSNLKNTDYQHEPNFTINKNIYEFESNEKKHELNAFNESIELCQELFLMKQQKLTFKKYKSFYFVLNDTHYLSYYKSKEESNGRPIDKINLKGCELVPDVNVTGRKFGINFRVPSSEGMNEMSLRCPDEESYAKWMSACKLASKNKPITDQAFKTEVKSILNLLQMQQNKPVITKLDLMTTNNNNIQNDKNTKTKSLVSSSPSLNYSSSSAKSNKDNADVQATNLLPIRMLKKYKLKQLNDRILEAYSGISDLDLFESKWHYIKAWQALPNYGITYFAVKIKGSRFKEEIIGVASNRLLRINPEGETIKTWRFNTMKSWNVNWDIKQFEIIFDEELLIFTCSNFDAKILHEFIGGYIFLSIRAQEKSEPLDDEMFFKLTEKR